MAIRTLGFFWTLYVGSICAEDLVNYVDFYKMWAWGWKVYVHVLLFFFWWEKICVALWFGKILMKKG